MIEVNKDKCARCGGCVGVCPTSALTLLEHGITCSDKCIDCEFCVRFCPVDALKVKK
ncbi:MAG: 4Fe-4S binding protein [Nanoarchaeota archaeon]